MYYGEHGVDRQRRESEREKRLHSPFALNAPIQWDIQGYVIKNRGWSYRKRFQSENK